MSQHLPKTSPAQDSGGAGVAAPTPAPTYHNNLLGPDGQALNPNLRRVLAQGGGGAALYVARFYHETETLFAVGAWVNPKLARPPASRHTGYACRLIARYYAPDRAELPGLLAGLLAAAAPAARLGGAACWLDPWPLLRALPAGARRAGPAVIGGPASALRPESARARSLRRQLAQVQAQLAQVRQVPVGAGARVGLPGSPRLWLTLPVGAELRAAAQGYLLAQVGELEAKLAAL